MTESNARIIVDPLNDALLQCGKRYLEMVGCAPDQEKGRQFSTFLMLLEDRIESGEQFAYPSEEELPTMQLTTSDTITEGQSVKLVGKIVKTLELRRNARY